MKISALDRKLLRDLWRIRGQALAIALVVGAGVALYVLMLSAFDSLDLTQGTYYDRYRFGDVFASAKRAPMWLAEDIAAIPGVARVETRVIADVTLDVPGLVRPATGRLISIPETRRAILCDIYLKSGRYIDPGQADEVLVNEPFALANDLRPGDSVTAVINGRRRRLRIVGLALSPEYIYQIRPGELIADDALFGVFWMERRALAAAFQMEGGFNDAVLALSRGASTDEVTARLDELLKPYGGLGAIPRALQPSHFYLQAELDGLKGSAAVVPVIFLAVAAFLLNVVLTRVVTVQREQIAELKAIGYGNGAVAMHYVKWSLSIAGVGSAMGIAAGAWLGLGLTRMYTMFYHFPILQYRLLPGLVVEAVLVSLVAAVVGALAAVRKAVKLPPAAAMRPEAPASYGETWIERAGMKRWLSQPARMILRNLRRHPARAALSVTGIGVAGALLIVGTFSLDSVERMVDIQFNVAERHDAMVSFVEPVSPRAIHDVKRLPGVMDAEPFRSVPARLCFGHRSRDTSITALVADSRLNRVIDASLKPVPLPPDGLVLSATLADVLGAGVGDTVEVEVLVEKRPVRDVRIEAVVKDYMGTSAYMRLDAMNRMLDEGEVLSGAYLMVDSNAAADLYRKVKETPAVAGVAVTKAAIENLWSTIGETFAISRDITILFAAIIVFGVVYNSARISLSERSRELATLRVIGFRRHEIAYILLGELALVTLMAIPLVIAFGYAMAAGVVQMYHTEVFRLPLVVSSKTFAVAVVTVVVSSLISALAVRRKLHHLDLVSVLKTRE